MVYMVVEKVLVGDKGAQRTKYFVSKMRGIILSKLKGAC